jgi:lipoprotein-anchoring transpeptidase ErfK/SrfK
MRRVVFPMLVLLSLYGCGGHTATTPSTAPNAPALAAAAPKDPPLAIVKTAADPEVEVSQLSTRNLAPGSTLVARLERSVGVYDSVDSKIATRTLPATTILGTPTVIDVLDGPVAGWALVSLPGRPNGSQGWIRSEGLSLSVVSGKITIDLSSRRLTYRESGTLILATPVAVGTDRNPTPIGSFYVTDSVVTGDPGGIWGPAAFGLSARSDTITEYNGGDGIIGIHGTNRSASIGRASSLGCVRVPNDVIEALRAIVPIGTPVEILA